MKNDEIILRESYLSSNHVPENLTNRKNELDQMERFLLPVSERSNVLLVYGPTGSGKTTCVRRLLQDLEDSTTASTVYLDCWEYRTKTAILAKTLIELGVPVPRKGKPVDTLYEKVERLVRKGNLIVALDSFGYPNANVGALYTLGELVGKGLSLILVAKDRENLRKMKRQVRSRLVPVTVRFGAYSEEEISDILNERAKKAFREGSWTEGSIQRIAQAAAESGGDCKLALTLLEISARAAEDEGRGKLTAEVVESVIEELDLTFGGDED